MNALASLEQDHVMIREVLDALERFVTRIESQRHVDKQTLERFATFFVTFADIHHAIKEEQVLFPALERHGAPWDHGPLAHARREHRQERYFMRTMMQLATQERDADEESRRVLVSELTEFIQSLRDHLQLEEAEVFPFAESMAPSAQRDLETRLDRFDATPPSDSELPKMQALAQTLKDGLT